MSQHHLRRVYRRPWDVAFRLALGLVCTCSIPAMLRAAEDHAASIRQLLAQDRWVEALDEARRAHAASPDDVARTSLLAETLYRAGRFAEVERLLGPLAGGDALPPRGRLTLARLRHAEGRFPESSELLKRAVEAAPDDPDVLYWAADVAPSRAQTIELLGRYLERAAEDDTDRIEDARGTLSVLRQLGERKVWLPVDRPERLELPLRHVWDEAGATIGYVLEAQVGPKHKTARLLLDTGNPGLYLVRRLARKGGFVPLGKATTFGGGGDRRHRVERGMFATFAIAGLSYADALATSTPQELDATGRFHGLLGLTPFGGYRVILDLTEKRLTLEPSDEPIDGAPYWIVAGQILVQAAAEGAEPGLFLFDTGASRSLLATAYAEGIPGATLREEATVRGLGGAYEGARRVDGARLVFHGVRGDDDPSAVDLSLRSRMTGVEICGYLGLELLDRTKIVIDTHSRRIRVTP